MTPRDKRNSGPRPSAGRAAYEDSARLFERVAAVFAGIAIALRPLLPDHALRNSSTLLLHSPIVLAAFLWLVAQGMRGRVRIARCGGGMPLIIYAVVIAVSPLAATYKYAALQALPVWLTNLLLLFLVLNLSADKDFRRFFIAVFLASAAVVVFHGLYQRADGLEEFRRMVKESGFISHLRSASERQTALARVGGDEPFASFTTSNILATFLLIAVPALFGSAVAALRNRPARGWALRAAILFLAMAAGLLCLYFTGSTAAHIVFAAQLMIFPLILFRRWVWKHRLAFAVCLAVIIAAFAAFGTPFVKRLAETRSVNYRFGYWTGGWGVFKENWLTGVGLENFQYNYPAHKPPWAGEVQYPHNCIVQSATEFGVMGLIAFVAIWVLFITRILRSRNDTGKSAEEIAASGGSRRPFMLLAGGITLAFVFVIIMINQPFESFSTSLEKGLATAVAAALIWAAVFAACGLFAPRGNEALLGAALATGALGFFLHCQFDFGIEAYAVNQACWLAVALALATDGARFSEGRGAGTPARVLLILVGFGAIIFYMLGPMSLAIKEDGALGNDPEPNYEALSKAAAANPLNAETHRDLAGKYYEFWIATDRQKGEFAEKAIEEAREAIRLNPANFAYHIDAAMMFQEMGRKAEALEEYDLAVERYPAKPAIRVYRATLEDSLGVKEEARRDIEEAARLLKANRMPDGSIRFKELELDTERGLPGHGSEKETYENLRAKYQIE